MESDETAATPVDCRKVRAAVVQAAPVVRQKGRLTVSKSKFVCVDDNGQSQRSDHRISRQMAQNGPEHVVTHWLLP